MLETRKVDSDMPRYARRFS